MNKYFWEKHIFSLVRLKKLEGELPKMLKHEYFWFQIFKHTYLWHLKTSSPLLVFKDFSVPSDKEFIMLVTKQKKKGGGGC